MPEPTMAELRVELAAATRDGEVFPSVVRLLDERRHWSGRRAAVLRLVASDLDRLRYLCGGDRPGEVADCVECWSESKLSLEDIELVLNSGGYDPDPFVVLAEAGVLQDALVDETGAIRHIHAERAGTWISDELALASPEATLARTREAIGETVPHSPG